MYISQNQFVSYEQTVLDLCMKHHHGYELMWVGLGEIESAKSSPINHQFKIGFGKAQNISAAFDECGFPLANESIDLIVLNHLLEQYKHFDTIIKEIHRVLRRDGMLLITGFNPLRQRSHSLAKKIIGKRRFYFRSTSQLRKKIEPVGFSLYKHYFYGFADSDSMETWCRKYVSGLSVGYALLLQKRSVKLTPLKTGWTADALSEVASVVKPAVKPAVRSPII